MEWVRGTRRLAFLAFCGASTGSCYDPELADCKLACALDGSCPDGQHCDHGFCSSSRSCEDRGLDPAGGSGGTGGTDQSDGGRPGAGARDTSNGGEDSGGSGTNAGAGAPGREMTGGEAGAGGNHPDIGRNTSGDGGTSGVAGGNSREGSVGGSSSGAGGSLSGAGGAPSGVGGSPGGMGGSGGAPVLSVFSTTPPANATGIAPDTLIRATFSEALETTSIGAGACTLSAGPDRIAGTVSALERTLTFESADLLEIGTEYEVSLSTEIEGVSGARLSAPYSFQFTTRRQGIATRIDSDPNMTARGATIVTDRNGNAVAVWRQSLDGDPAAFDRDGVWASRYDAAASRWSAPQRLDGVDLGVTAVPRLAMDPEGNAFVVWAQPASAGAPSSAWSIRTASSNPNVGWEAPVLLESDDSGAAEQARIAVDAAGNAVALWLQSSGGPSTTRLWSNRYVAASSAWGTRVQVATQRVASQAHIELAMAPSGTAVAIWDGAFSSWLAPGAAWTSPVRVQNNNAHAFQVAIGIDAQGNALAIWTEWDGVHHNAWAARHTGGPSWETAVNLQSEPLADASQPRLAVAPDGTAIAIWRQSTEDLQQAMRLGGVWSNVYVPNEAGWYGAAQLTPSSASAEVVVNASGRAAITWDEGRAVLGNAGPLTSSNPVEWGRMLEVQAGQVIAERPQVAIGESGVTFVAWVQSSGLERQVWVNRVR